MPSYWESQILLLSKRNTTKLGMQMVKCNSLKNQLLTFKGFLLKDPQIRQTTYSRDKSEMRVISFSISVIS